jgi:hypothetical protein
LERYKIAWTAVKQSPAPLDNGAPVNFLSNPVYTLSSHIPWFDQANFPPSVSRAAPQPTPQPAIASTSSGPGTSGVQPLSSHLSSPLDQTDYKIDLIGQFPKIRGFNKGFVEYLRSKDKPRIQVVFILDPKFVSTKVIDAYNGPVEIGPDDAKAVMEEMNGCIHEAEDQSDCKPGQKRYICMSWVRPSGYMIESQLIIGPSAHPCIWIEGNDNFSSAGVYELE